MLWVSLVNEGYVPFAKHFIQNVRALFGERSATFPLLIACTHVAAFDALKGLWDACILLCPHDPSKCEPDRPLAHSRCPLVAPSLHASLSDLMTYGSATYKQIVFAKLDVMAAATLVAAEMGCRAAAFIDFDVALLQDPTGPIADLLRQHPDVSVFAQCDEQSRQHCSSRDKCPWMCSGVLAFRCRDRDLFKAAFDYDAKDFFREGDQSHLLHRFNALRVRRLSLDRTLFPNGQAARVSAGRQDDVASSAVLVHFNWLRAAEKVPTMKAWRLWYGESCES